VAVPPELSLRTLVLPGEVDIMALAGIAAAGAAYALGIRRLAARGRAWPVARTASFIAGLVALLVATESGVARYDNVLFSAHVVQHLLLGMLAPVLLVLGRPLTLALQTAAPANRRALRRLLSHRVVRALTNPVVAAVLFTVSLVAVYLTPVYGASLRWGPVHAWLHMHLFGVGCLFAIGLIGADLPRRGSYPLRLLVVLATVPAHAVLGLALLGPRVVAGDYYAKLGRTWGPSLLADQHAGAGLMWASGEVFGLVLAGVVFVQWWHASAREAARLDHAAVA